MRFHIAIEDGSCQVERDLGSLTAQASAHLGSSRPELIDDLFILKAAPDLGADAICESALGDEERFGALGQRWAKLWREVYGARLGCYNAKTVGKRRAMKQGTYVACKAGVLVAAESAALTRMAQSTGEVRED